MSAAPKPADRYETTPDSGAWVFVADREAFDSGSIRGEWISLGSEDHAVLAQVAAAAGRPLDLEDLIVIDQIGVPSEMVDEDLFATTEAV